MTMEGIVGALETNIEVYCQNQLTVNLLAIAETTKLQTIYL